jgi:hypothetical protein
MKEKIKRLDPNKTRSLVLNPGERELMLKINEMVERVNDLEEKLSSLNGEKLWEFSHAYR